MKILKLVIFAIIVLTVSFLAGSRKIKAANPPIDGVLRVPTGLNANTRYFTNNSEKAIYLTGSHTWANLQDYKKVSQNRPDFDYVGYLNFLESSNHNFIRLWIANDAECDWKNGISAIPSVFLRVSQEKPCVLSAVDDGAKYDLSQVNPAFLTRLRERVQAAKDRGIYVSIMFFDSVGAGYTDDIWSTNALESNPFLSGNNENGVYADINMIRRLHTNESSGDMRNRIKDFQKNYIKEVVEEVNGFDNVLFEIGNELPYQSIEFQYELINYIHDLEAAMPNKHPVGMTPGGPDVSMNSWAWKSITYAELTSSPADWISPSFPEKIPGEPYKEVPLASAEKVNILDTDHGGNPRPDNDHTGVWKAFLRGYNYIYMDVYQLPFALYDPIPNPDYWWNDVKNTGFGTPKQARMAMGNTKAYADRMDLATMIPSDNPLDCSTTFCLRNPGQEYLIYQSGSGVITVNLLTGSYSLEWFDSFNGKKVSRGAVAAASDGNKSFTPPSVIASGSVLYLKKFNPAECTDNDGDGYFAGGSNCEFLDCNDSNANINPLAMEVCSDGVDNDCDGIDKACDLNLGLVGRWKFDGNAADSSEKNNNGTLRGGMSCSAMGKIGQACRFDGTDDYVSVPDSTSLRLDKDITIDAWINWNGTFHGVEDWSFILEKGYGDDDNYAFGICGEVHPNMYQPCYANRLFFEYKDKNNLFHTYKGSKVIEANQMINVAVVFDSAQKTLTFYHKGELDKQHTIGSDLLKGTQIFDLLIGRQNYGEGSDSTLWFSGLIDEVRIYNRALGEKEIAMLANPSPFVPADINNDTHINIKDIQICIKAIIAPLTIPDEHLLKCQAVVPPVDAVNIKDIQEIIRKIIAP